jgi:hypothetical protein
VRDDELFERELERTLERVPAPEGFADRVMGRVRAREQGRLRMMVPRTTPVWRAAIAAMALIAVLSGAGEWVRQREERRQAEAVQRQFEVAMRVTGRTLDGIQERISKAGVKEEKGER